jgi:hypothetical protein
LKKVIIVSAMLVLFATSAFASSIELAQTGDLQTISLCVQKPLNNKVGAFALSTQNKLWGQTYAGLTYSPIPNIELGYGAGFEAGGDRTGGWIWAMKDSFSGIYIFENGASGPWHKLVVKITITPKFNLGYTEKSYAGSGVYAEYKLDKTTTIKYSGFKEPEIALNLRF